jgi:hypothetical protein
MKRILYSICESIVPIPAVNLDLPQWLFKLSDTEYQACSKAHLGAGASILPNGKQSSINVESVGGHLFIQHYIPEISTPHHIKMVSNSDCWLFKLWYVQFKVIWNIMLIPKSDGTTILRNEVEIEHPRLVLKILVKLGFGQMFLKRHNAEETPLFAKNMFEKFGN